MHVNSLFHTTQSKLQEYEAHQLITVAQIFQNRNQTQAQVLPEHPGQNSQQNVIQNTIKSLAN